MNIHVRISLLAAGFYKSCAHSLSPDSDEQLTLKRIKKSPDSFSSRLSGGDHQSRISVAFKMRNSKKPIPVRACR
jgi:hypothetical protein